MKLSYHIIPLKKELLNLLLGVKADSMAFIKATNVMKTAFDKIISHN